MAAVKEQSPAEKARVRAETALLDECEEYAEKVRVATEGRNAAIIAARNGGCSIGRIATAVGLSKPGVTYIIEHTG